MFYIKPTPLQVSMNYIHRYYIVHSDKAPSLTHKALSHPINIEIINKHLYTNFRHYNLV